MAQKLPVIFGVDGEKLQNAIRTLQAKNGRSKSGSQYKGVVLAFGLSQEIRRVAKGLPSPGTRPDGKPGYADVDAFIQAAKKANVIDYRIGERGPVVYLPGEKPVTVSVATGLLG